MYSGVLADRNKALYVINLLTLAVNHMFRTNVLRNQAGSPAEMLRRLTYLLNASKLCNQEDVSTAVAPTQTKPSVNALKFMIMQVLIDVRGKIIGQLELKNKKRNYSNYFKSCKTQSPMVQMEMYILFSR